MEQLTTAPAAPAPAGPEPVYKGLLACLPETYHSVNGDLVQIQGSPGFQCVYVRVAQELVAIPLDVAYQVANVIRDHAARAQLVTVGHLQEQARRGDTISMQALDRALGPIRRAGL